MALNSPPRMLAVLCAACAALAGCGGYSNDDLEFLYALPSRAALQTSVPASSTARSGSELGVRRDGLAVGEPSKAYADTKSGSDGINELLYNVLDVLERVRTARPSERTENRRVWGPFADDRNRTRQLRVVIERRDLADGSVAYEWRWEVKQRDAGEDGWLAGASGTFSPTDDVRRGAGEFSWHAKAIRDGGFANTDDDREVESLQVFYETDRDPVRIDMTMRRTNGELSYGYERSADGSGAIRFELVADFYKPFLGEDRETLTIHSRWTPEGTGRADLRISGGDLGIDRRDAVECWDAAFLVVHARPFDFSGEPTVGDPAACAFTGAP